MPRDVVAVDVGSILKWQTRGFDVIAINAWPNITSAPSSTQRCLYKLNGKGSSPVAILSPFFCFSSWWLLFEFPLEITILLLCDSSLSSVFFRLVSCAFVAASRLVVVWLKMPLGPMLSPTLSLPVFSAPPLLHRVHLRWADLQYHCWDLTR